MTLMTWTTWWMTPCWTGAELAAAGAELCWTEAELG